MSMQQEPQNQFQHHITAAVIIAGTQKGQVDTHGGNQEGGHITATFGSQLMVTMLDREGALAFAQAWTDPENRWVFKALPESVQQEAGGNDLAGAVGPGITVRASGSDEGKVWTDTRTRFGVVRVGNLTWYVRDQAAAESMILTWAYIARLAPTVLRPAKPRRRERS